MIQPAPQYPFEFHPGVTYVISAREGTNAYGKPVELVLFDKAGHGFQQWQDNLIAYRKTGDFLSMCLGGHTGGFDFFELGAKLF